MEMFYALLILPHITAIGALMWFAYKSDIYGGREDAPDDWRWEDEPPTPPSPRTDPGTGPPLPDAEQPRPRLQVGEQLSERVVRRPRREHPPLEPERTPQKH